MHGDNEEIDGKTKDVTTDEKYLKNWSNWQKEWERVQGAITQKLHRQPGNLVMNYGEGLQKIETERVVLDYARIPTEFDKYRGKPDFFELPAALARRFSCGGKPTCRCKQDCFCNSEPTYFAVKTKPEAYIVPSVELVGTPNYILEEKNIRRGTRSIYRKWRNSKYRQEQMNKLSEKISAIVPHWPRYEELIVLGTKMTNDQSDEELHHVSEKDASEIPENELTSFPSEASITESEAMRIANPRLYLEINGLSLVEDSERENLRKLRLFFEFDITSSKRSINFVIIINHGCITMRVSWKKMEKFRILRNYEEEKLEKHGFYFDKRELIILPGEKVYLPIWFKTENSGNCSECWELITVPTIWGSKLILMLQSYSYYKDLKEKADRIVEYIEIQARNLLIKDILHDILEEVKYDDAPVTPCVFGEAELFEVANVSSGRPLFSYDRDLVETLQEIYDKVKSEDVSWDYSMKYLKKLALVKDTSIYLENKATEISEKVARIQSGQTEKIVMKGKAAADAKGKKGKKDKGSSKGSKSSGKGKGKGKGKDSARAEPEEVKMVITREPLIYSNQVELSDVIRKFDCPVILNSVRQKYFACTSVMTAYFNKMSNQLQTLESDMKLIGESCYPPIKNKLIPIEEQPDRLIYEQFELHHVPTHPDDEVYTFEMKHKPPNVRDIPSDDIENLYTTYFNKSLKQDKKGGKKDKGKKAKDKKEKGKGKPDKKGKDSAKGTGVKKEASIVNFDPYSERFSYNLETPETEPPADSAQVIDLGSVSSGFQKNDLPKLVKEDYFYKQYLIVYSCLGDAVDALVDTLHSFECIVSYPTLNVISKQLPAFEEATEETNEEAEEEATDEAAEETIEDE